jgi:hypothetical protein
MFEKYLSVILIVVAGVFNCRTSPVQHFLYFLPLPQGQGSFTPIFAICLSPFSRLTPKRSRARGEGP